MDMLTTIDNELMKMSQFVNAVDSTKREKLTKLKVLIEFYQSLVPAFLIVGTRPIRFLK